MTVRVKVRGWIFPFLLLKVTNTFFTLKIDILTRSG